MFKGVIFDLDGTLLNTIGDITDAVNAALFEYTNSQITLNECMELVGNGAENLALQVTADKCKDVDYKDILKSYLKIYAEISCNKTRLYPDVEELLLKLKDNNLKLAVLSNKPHNDTVAVVNHYFRKDTFDIILGKKEEFRVKPYPDSCDYIIKQFNLKKDEIILVGDSDTDIMTAKNANLKVIAVTWGFRKRNVLEALQPDYICNNIYEIEEVIIK